MTLSQRVRPCVLLIAAQLEPMRGMERAVIAVAESLAETHDVAILCLSGLRPRALSPAVDFETLALPRTHMRLARATLRLRRALQEVPQSTQVVAAGIWAAVPSLTAAPQRGIIVWEHSLLAERVAADRRVRLLAFIAARLYRRARAIVAVSGAVREYVSQTTPLTPCLEIPNPLPRVPDAATLSTRQGQPTVLYLGSLIPSKNVQLLVRSIRFLDRAVNVVIAGDGRCRRPLEELATTEGVADRVLFAGEVADPGELFRDAFVLAQPSLSETFGLVLFEAADHGVPVVALNRPNMNRLVPTVVPGLLSSAETPEAFASTLSYALKSNWPQATFTQAARVRSSRFSADAVRNDWNALLSTPAIDSPTPASST